MSLKWLQNGSGWLKVILVCGGLLAGYCTRVGMDSQRIATLEDWRLEHNGMVTGPQEQRLRIAEANIAAILAVQTLSMERFDAIQSELRDIRDIMSQHYRRASMEP